MAKPNVKSAQDVIDILNTCGWDVMGFNNKRQWMSRKTGQMETIPFANMSIRNKETKQTFFMNRGRDGQYTLKEAAGQSATAKAATPSRSSVSRGDEQSLEARFSKMETLLSKLADRI